LNIVKANGTARIERHTPPEKGALYRESLDLPQEDLDLRHGINLPEPFMIPIRTL